jgi:hypothetical protein
VTFITEGEVKKDSEASQDSALKTHFESHAPGCLIFQEIRTANRRQIGWLRCAEIIRISPLSAKSRPTRAVQYDRFTSTPADRNAQIPAIRGRLGALVNSTRRRPSRSGL